MSIPEPTPADLELDLRNDYELQIHGWLDSYPAKILGYIRRAVHAEERLHKLEHPSPDDEIRQLVKLLEKHIDEIGVVGADNLWSFEEAFCVKRTDLGVFIYLKGCHPRMMPLPCPTMT